MLTGVLARAATRVMRMSVGVLSLPGEMVPVSLREGMVVVNLQGGKAVGVGVVDMVSNAAGTAISVVIVVGEGVDMAVIVVCCGPCSIHFPDRC